MKKFVLFFLLALSLTFWSCEKKSSNPTEATDSDIPADPGTAPPSVKNGPLKPAVGVKLADDRTNRVQLNIGGLFHQGSPIQYTTNNLVILEDGVVKGYTIRPITSVTLETNVVFIIDVTGSMSGTISGIKESIIAFLNNLKSKGLNVKCGAVAYSDNNDTRIPYSTNGIASNTDPGAYTVVEFHNLTANFDSSSTLFSFISGLYSSYRGYDGGDIPEGGFDAIYYAYQNFSWSPGAQKVFVVLTDAPSWGKYAPLGSGTTRSPWRTDSLANVLAGNATVHVVSPIPSKISSNIYNGSYDMHYLATPGTFSQYGINYTSGGTGGLWIDLYNVDLTGRVDLTTLPISTVASQSVRAEYITKTPGKGKHLIRVVVDIGTANGEVTVEADY